MRILFPWCLSCSHCIFQFVWGILMGFIRQVFSDRRLIKCSFSSNRSRKMTKKIDYDCQNNDPMLIKPFINPNWSQCLQMPSHVLFSPSFVMQEVLWVSVAFSHLQTSHLHFLQHHSLQMFISPLIKISFTSMIQCNHRCYPLFMLLMTFSPLGRWKNKTQRIEYCMR